MRLNLLLIWIVLLWVPFCSLRAQNNLTDHWEMVFPPDTTFRYWDSNMGAPDENWRMPGYSDEHWKEGRGGIGYGDDDDTTVLEPCVAVFLRREFTISSPEIISRLAFYIDYDDAFVAHLNGVTIARSAGLSEDFPDHNTLAAFHHEAGDPEWFEIDMSLFQEIAFQGENILTFQFHNAAANSTDLSSAIYLFAGINTSEQFYLPPPDWLSDVIPVLLNSSNLPIIKIQTLPGQPIVDEPKVTAKMSVIYNESGERNRINDLPDHYDGTIGIEWRGKSSLSFPKKSYALETRNEDGSNRNVSLLGMPEENDWVLIASYLDHTFCRNLLAGHLATLTGSWASRGRLVEVILDGQYQGIYVLMEKIKRDVNRLNIDRLDPNDISGEEITGGYVYEITGFENNMGESRNLKIPDIDVVTPSQLQYIISYDNTFRDVMASSSFADTKTGYHAWIDVNSFVNELIVQEAMRNSDAYGWSAYFHKDRGKKLRAGPVWDFDQSSGNSAYPDDGVVEGWMFEHPYTNNTPFFWKRLWEDPFFRYQVKRKWTTLRENEFRDDKLVGFIDSVAYLLVEAQTREFTRWKVLGNYTWRETRGFENRDTYEKEIGYLKSFLLQRWAWMDSELEKVEDPPNQVFPVVFPNPASYEITFNFECPGEAEVNIDLFHQTGVRVHTQSVSCMNSGLTTLIIPLKPDWPGGNYLYRLSREGALPVTGKLVVLPHR